MSLSQEEKRANLSKKAAIDKLWRNGIVHWKLDKNQLEMLDFVKNTDHTMIVIASSRQIGKSYFLVLLALQTCLATPNTVVKYVAPKVKDIKNVVLGHVRDITQDCPKELIPKYNSQDHIFYFKNGSMIQLAAAENGHIDGIRGTKADMCIVDEAGFCSDLDYAINSVLLPTTTTTGGKIIIASTPAKTPDHDFVKIMLDAEMDNRLIRKTIYDNPRLSEADIEKLAKACGGTDTVQFRREYLAENIISEEDAVIPEFTTQLQEKIIKDVAIPPHFDGYVSMDIGMRDMTAILFAYLDFLEGKLVILDEICLTGKEVITDNIAYLIKSKEEQHWTNKMTGEVKQPALRIADNNNPILVNDLSIKHQLNFIPTLKDNKDAALNNMRLLLKTEKIVIHPRCKTLITHLRSAVWNKARSNYARSSDKGHFDMVDAMVYLCRNVNFTKNPYPADFKFGGYKDIYYSEPVKEKTDFEKNLEKQFKIIKPRRGFGRF